jgi:hypothetical protein
VRYLQAIHQTANTHPQLLATGVDGSARDMTSDQIHRKVWPLVAPALREQQVAAANTYRALPGTGRTSREPAEAFAAAQEGRVDTLFLSADAPEWRTRASGGPLVRLGDTPSTGEQLDLAAVATLRHAGAVYAVPASRMPDTNPVAAILRY